MTLIGVRFVQVNPEKQVILPNELLDRVAKEEGVSCWIELTQEELDNKLRSLDDY